MDERTEAQLGVIGEIDDAMARAGIPWWLFGGWGLDARLGEVTRAHGERTRDALVGAGFIALDTQPVEESCEFTTHPPDNFRLLT